jgi:hypothetical protein
MSGETLKRFNDAERLEVGDSWPTLPSPLRCGGLHHRAIWLPCSRQWLAKLAVIGGGPVFHKAGRYPVYEPSELDLWAEARIGPPQRSTSEVEPA